MKHQPLDNFDFSKMSIAERILLVESLWDGIYRESQKNIELTNEHKQELNSRLAAEDAGKITFSSWNDARQRLLAK